MENTVDECANAAPDQICPIDELVAWLAPFVGLGVPLALLGLSVWAVVWFWRRLRAGQTGEAVLIVLGGYAVMFVIMAVTYPLGFATYMSWGLFLIFITFSTWMLGIYTLASIVALLVFLASRPRSA